MLYVIVYVPAALPIGVITPELLMFRPFGETVNHGVPEPPAFVIVGETVPEALRHIVEGL